MNQYDKLKSYRKGMVKVLETAKKYNDVKLVEGVNHLIKKLDMDIQEIEIELFEFQERTKMNEDELDEMAAYYEKVFKEKELI